MTKTVFPDLNIRPAALLVFGVVVVLSAAGTGVAQTQSSSHPLNLSGRIVDQSGRPLSDTSVFVYTAGPRVGRGSL